MQVIIRIGRSLHHKPPAYIVVICNWVIELSLQVINGSDYTHTGRSTLENNLNVLMLSVDLGS